MRSIAGIIAGLIVGFLVAIAVGVVVFGAAGGAAPSPGNVNLSDPQRVVEIFAELPVGAKIGLMLAWFGAALAGVAVAKLIAPRRWVAWTVTGLIALYVVANIFVLPMPGWMQALSVVAPLLGGLIANHLVADRSEPDLADEDE